MGKKKRDSISFLDVHLQVIGEVLSGEECWRLIDCMRRYALWGETPDISQESALFCSMYGLLKEGQDAMLERYEETCERNRRIARERVQRERVGGQVEAALRSGAYQMEQTVTTQTKQNKTKQNKTKQNGEETPPAGGPALMAHEEGTGSARQSGVPGAAWL